MSFVLVVLPILLCYVLAVELVWDLNFSILFIYTRATTSSLMIFLFGPRRQGALWGRFRFIKRNWAQFQYELVQSCRWSICPTLDNGDWDATMMMVHMHMRRAGTINCLRRAKWSHVTTAFLTLREPVETRNALWDSFSVLVSRCLFLSLVRTHSISSYKQTFCCYFLFFVSELYHRDRFSFLSSVSVASVSSELCIVGEKYNCTLKNHPFF